MLKSKARSPQELMNLEVKSSERTEINVLDGWLRHFKMHYDLSKIRTRDLYEECNVNAVKSELLALKERRNGLQGLMCLVQKKFS